MGGAIFICLYFAGRLPSFCFDLFPLTYDRLFLFTAIDLTFVAVGNFL